MRARSWSSASRVRRPNACRVVAEAVAEMPQARECKCGSALSHAILTDRSQVPSATRQKLGILIDKYFV